MKKLQCEMCGSGEFVKDGDFFVCQSCGMKYTTETAQKMMIEGTVNVEGTVTVDKSADLAKFYEIARRAREDGNNETAAQYYNMILAQEPTSWEAYFYATYFKALQCKIAGIGNAAVSITNSLESVFQLINKNESEKLSCINEVVRKCTEAVDLLYLNEKNHYDGIDQSIKDQYTAGYIATVQNIITILYVAGDCIEKIFADSEIKKYAVDLWKSTNEKYSNMSGSASQSGGLLIDTYAIKVGKYDIGYLRERCRHVRATTENSYQAGVGCAIPLGIIMGLFFGGFLWVVLAVSEVSMSTCWGWSIGVAVVTMLCVTMGKISDEKSDKKKSNARADLLEAVINEYENKGR
ncbi:MAG: hypothetical protein IKU84_04480 [Clostridia bacterium]|nr:hypothetical protein [Clostridia bacterium]